MRAKKLLITGAALIALSFTGVASASYSKTNFKQFKECLRTEPVRFHGTIVEAAQATPELSTLAFAVQAAGLVDVLSDRKASFTVFAPLNSAFDAAPGAILDTLLVDTKLLGAVLTYRVIPGQARRQDPRRVFFPYEFKTVLGQSVFFNRSSDGPQVNQSNVECQSVKTDNGTVWLIDSVLLLQF